MFTVRGTLRDDPGGLVRELTWDRGRLSGNAAAVVVLQAEARARDGMDVGLPEGPFTTRNHLSNELSALALASLVFAPDATIIGDTPPRPPLPPGVVG